jgi:hypothetical protein
MAAALAVALAVARSAIALDDGLALTPPYVFSPPARSTNNFSSSTPTHHPLTLPYSNVALSQG